MTSRCFCLVVAIAALAPISRSSAQTPPSFNTLASFTGPGFTGGPKPSPDGRFLLISTSTEIRVYETATGQTRKVADGTGGEFAWSPRGDRIAWVRGGDDGSGEYVWTMPIDPKTAAPSGPAQRVSMGQGEFPAISFDAQWIAYSAPDTEGAGSTNGLLPHHLSVVPVTGGPERVLAHFQRGVDAIHWSVDGKSIYLAGSVNGKRGVVKVATNGRQPPQLVREGVEFVVGMTADRRHVVLVPAKSMVAPGDRALVVDTTGKEVARIPLPVGSLISYMGIIGDSAIVWLDVEQRRRIETRALAGGPATRVSLTGESNEAPVWSPDGKRIAFQVRNKRRISLGLMNADGTNLHVFDDTDVRPSPGLIWSPDSKYVGFVGFGGQRLTIVDVASRSTRHVVEDTSVRLGLWTWRADSKSIAAVMIKQPAPPRGTIDEITLSGPRRRLIDFGTLDPQLTSGFVFVDDWTVLYRSDSVRFLVNLRDGSRRSMGAVPGATIVSNSAVSTDRKWVGGALWDSKHPGYNQFELLSTETNERKVIEVPFKFAWNSQSVFLPDGRSLLAFGQPATDSASTYLYSMPLDGGSPRVIARMPNTPTGAAVSLAPDGKSVAYSFQESRTVNLLLVDLRARSAQSSTSPR